MDIGSTTDADKQPQDRAKAFDLVKQVNRIVAVKGRSVFELDLTQKPTTDEIANLIIGPTGRLRAPSFRKGSTLVVGFTPEAYERALAIASPAKASRRKVASARADNRKPVR